MDGPRRAREISRDSDVPPDVLGHPRGTLAIVLIFGLLLGVGWLALYLFVFLERGAPG